MTLTKPRPSTDFVAARRAMIDSQLRVTGVNDPAVLARFFAVPREDHVPAEARSTCYMDRATPLGGGRFLAAPLSHGLMLEEAKPVLGDKVLLVDGGSGYLAELVRPLVGSLEVIAPEDAVTKSRKTGDFTLLLVDGAVEELPEELIRRMADKGRVVTGMVRSGVTRLAAGRKAAGKVALLPLADVSFARLSAFDKPAGWSF